MSNRAKLYEKILNVVSKMEAIEKSGYNAHQKYHYSTEEDLVNGIRQLLIDQKLVILTSSETKEVLKLNKPNGQTGTKETLVAVVNTTHKIIDAETGEFDTVTSTGTGWDDTDKMTFKAITGALKYFIGKNFLVPSKDDAENDGVTVPKQKTEPIKVATGFNRTKTVVTSNPTQNSTAQVVVDHPTEVKVVAEQPKVDKTNENKESQFAPEPANTIKNAPAKRSFGQRTLIKSGQTKTEPSF